MKTKDIIDQFPGISVKEIISKHRSEIMGIAMVSIMLFHQPFIWSKYDVFFRFFRFFGHFGVDIFLFLSGFGIAFSLKKNKLYKFYKKRFDRIVPICFFCGLIKYLICTLSPSLTFHVSRSWKMLFGFDLWFIRFILICYIVSPLIYWIIKHYGCIIMIVIAL